MLTHGEHECGNELRFFLFSKCNLGPTQRIFKNNFKVRKEFTSKLLIDYKCIIM